MIRRSLKLDLVKKHNVGIILQMQLFNNLTALRNFKIWSRNCFQMKYIRNQDNEL